MPAAKYVLNNIIKILSDIGHTEDTRFPGLTKKEDIAHEYIVAKTIARHALKRLELAEKAATSEGVIGDRSKLEKGQEVTVWKPKKVPPSVFITARTSMDRLPMLDRALLEKALRKHVTAAVADRIYAESLKPVEPTVTYSVVFFN